MEESEKNKEKLEPEFKDYVALVIAFLSTVMVPLVVIIAFLFALVLFLLFLGYHPI